MSSTVDPKVTRLVRAVAAEAAGAGARAVVLTGSHARGDATEHSDIDIVVLGRGPEYRLHRRGAYLVSVEWRSPAAERAILRTPRTVGAAVPGWRDAIILHDPTGVAERLQRAAVAFRWDPIASACDAWVANEITGFAEEVHKLVGARRQHHAHTAAVQRTLLAVRLAPILAVHLRILYGTENVPWDRVGDAMGARWRRAQTRALGEGGDSLAVTCRAALELYAMAVDAGWRLLDTPQRAVVRHACAIAGHDVHANPRRSPRNTRKKHEREVSDG